MGVNQFQVRFHGRGGQGVVTAAELLSVAAFFEGRHSQAFPTFGSERAGAPVAAFCRIADREIRTRSPVSHPDAVVVADPTLLQSGDLFGGIGIDGYVLINTSRPVEALGLRERLGGLRRDRVVAIPATELALAHLGRPVPNAVLLGGLAALCHLVSLDSVQQALAERFSGPVATANQAAAAAAYSLVARPAELTGAPTD
jgi:pyruvate ferredoxin oxidoreductase gamma subunit